MTAVSRGDLVWIDFSHHGAASLKKRRPAVVVQNDAGNRFAPHTIVAAVRGDSQKGLPVHVPLPKGAAGLTKDSVVDCGFLATVPKELIKSRLGRLSAGDMRRVEQALRASLGLP